MALKICIYLFAKFEIHPTLLVCSFIKYFRSFDIAFNIEFCTYISV